MSVSSFDLRNSRFSSETRSKAVKRLRNSSLSAFNCLLACTATASISTVRLSYYWDCKKVEVLPDMVEDDVDIEVGFDGIIWNTPSSPLVINM